MSRDHLKLVDAVDDQTVATELVTEAVKKLREMQSQLQNEEAKIIRVKTAMPHHIDGLKYLLQSINHSLDMAGHVLAKMTPEDLVELRAHVHVMHNNCGAVQQAVNKLYGRKIDPAIITRDGDLFAFREYTMPPAG